jgi:quercetin dioxygenase-like cupin family protein
MTAGQIVIGPHGEKITLGEIGQTVLLDNERIRVWEVALEPGETQPWHLHHNPYLVLCLASSPCHMDWLNGDPARHIVETVGGVVYRPPSPVHMLTNDGDGVYRNRLVELKDLGEEAVGDLSGGGPREVGAVPGLPVVFDEDGIRVYEVELGPGDTVSLPTDRPPYLLITLAGDGPDGDVSYHPAGAAATLTHTGPDAFVGRLIELTYLKEIACRT